MNEIKVFENQQFGQIRSIVKDGEPWFVGRDVAERLGYANTKDAILTHVDEEDRCIIQKSEIATIENHIPKSALAMEFVHAIPNRGLTFINESGLHSLVLSSKLPQAKLFKRWITHEVIPAIRRHGGYLTPEKVEEVLLNPDTIIQLATQLKESHEKVRMLEAQREQDAPKVLFAQCVAASESDILIGQLAKILKQNGVDVGQNRLFEILRRDGYLISQKGGNWNMPTQRSMEQGLMRIKETCVTHADGHVTVSKTPKITGKGQIYFVQKYSTTA